MTEHRNSRKREVRALTISQKNISRIKLAREGARYPEVVERPRTRGDCVGRDRSTPCLFVACKFSLYLDVNDTGGIKLNYPDIEPGEMAPDQCCALDIAERGGVTLARVGDLMNMTRERVRQIEEKALMALRGFEG